MYHRIVATGHVASVARFKVTDAVGRPLPRSLGLSGDRLLFRTGWFSCATNAHDRRGNLCPISFSFPLAEHLRSWSSRWSWSFGRFSIVDTATNPVRVRVRDGPLARVSHHCPLLALVPARRAAKNVRSA